MRQDDGVDGDAQRLSQLVWMIFLKILDDNEQELELLNSNYVPAVPAELQWRSWAANEEGLTGSSLLNFVNNKLFPELRALPINKSNQRTQIVREVFEDSHNYMKNGTLLRQVANKINTIDFNKQDDRHSFNDIYETLLRSLQSAGNSGEYYTPRPVTKFIVEMVDPKFGESILDPACGTGGFLSNAIEHIRQQVKTPEDERLLQDSIRGVEKKQLPHLLCMTNMILHGIEVPLNIRRDNTLKRPLKDYGPTDRVDVVLTNPPFGGTEEPGIESNFPQTYRTRETADLFLVLIMKLLKPGGRAGIVLPDGFLAGEGVKTRIKEHLLNDCNLHTIVRLPRNVFSPYTDILTNLLFFEKGTPTKEIWERKERLTPDEANKLRLPRIEKIDFKGRPSLGDHKLTKTGMITVHKGDVLISGINADKGAVCVFNEADEATATIHYSAYEIDSDYASPEFLIWFLRSKYFQRKLVEQVGGGIKTEIKAKKFLSMDIPIPDKVAQQKIVNKLKVIDENVTELKILDRENFKLASHLKKLILMKVIGLPKGETWLPNEPYALPDDWEWKPLKDLIIEKPRNGYSPKAVHYDTSVKTLKLAATTSGKFIKTQFKNVDEDIPEDSYLWLEPGDILIQRSNSIDYVDRLSRNAGDLGSLVDLMDSNHLVHIRTFGQSFSNTPNEKFLLMILCSQAKLENDNRGVNVKRGIRAKCEMGWRPCMPPIGYYNRAFNGVKDIVEDPERAPYIKEMFERIALRVIAAGL
ncbi:unnamed protein product [Sphagnum jensenii]|uniref:site-specific DNA-methyltransferase (adenine-specific) n=1 Tax=Sphagnum jensenii TaxID=128206 RepID=A0ABP0VBQ4_9BRYO